MRKYLVSFLMVSTVIVACALKGDTPSSLRGVLIKWDVPLVSPDDASVNKMIDSCFVYYFEDLVMVRVPYAYTEYRFGKAAETSQEPSKTETKFKHYVFKKGQPTGLQFETITSVSLQKFDVDSLLKAKTLKGVRFHNQVNDRLVKVINTSDSTFLEMYAPKSKPDDSYSDSTYLYLTSKLKMGGSYSLSPEVDSLKKMKLYKVKFIYNPVPNGISHKIDIPRREITFGFSELSIKNPIEITNYFKRSKQYLK